MRSLVIAYEYPWPVNSGSRHRLSTTLQALSRCGPTRLFSITPASRTDFGEPDPALRLEGVRRVPVEAARGGVGSLVHPLLPSTIPTTARREVTRALAAFSGAAPDLVWFFDLRSWVLSGGPRPAPAVLDLDDLEHHKIQGRLSVDPDDDQRGSAPGGSGPRRAGGRMSRIPGRTLSRLDAARWARLSRTASSRVERTVVCSELDAERAAADGIERLAVVPNAYARPTRPAGRSDVGQPPVVLFHGTLRYPPNADAARWLARGIAPALRARVPEVEVRLAGLSTPTLAELHDPPGITLVGQVPDITTELARADVVIVPIRFGSGTRVKIIEAFAHRIPVVSTTMGAEGLGVEHGQQLLLADTTEDLASACAALLAKRPLRDRLVEAAYTHYVGAFERDVVGQRVAEVARAAMGESVRVASG